MQTVEKLSGKGNETKSPGFPHPRPGISRRRSKVRPKKKVKTAIKVRPRLFSNQLISFHFCSTLPPELMTFRGKSDKICPKTWDILGSCNIASPPSRWIQDSSRAKRQIGPREPVLLKPNHAHELRNLSILYPRTEVHKFHSSTRLRTQKKAAQI